MHWPGTWCSVMCASSMTSFAHDQLESAQLTHLLWPDYKICDPNLAWKYCKWCWTSLESESSGNSQLSIICAMLRNTFWWHFLLTLGIHARNVLWDTTNCARVDATSESLDQGHSEVKGQIGAFWYWNSFFYHLCNKVQVNLDFLIQLTTIRYNE